MSFNFGGTTSGAASGASLFGTAGAGAGAGSSPFASNQSNTGPTGGGGGAGGGGGGGIFGNVGATPASAATTSSSTPSLFGTPATSQPAQGGNSLFGASSANTSGSILGGGSSSSKPTFSFGNPSKDANAQSTTPAASGTNFLTPNKTTESTTPALTKPSGMFGAQASSGAAPSSLFGSATPATTGGGSTFGGPSTTPAGPPPAATSAGQGQPLFGGQQLSKPQGSGDASNLFGAKPAAATTAPAAPTTTSNAFSLGGTTPQAQPASNLFGSMGQQNSTQQSNLFNKPSAAGGLTGDKKPEANQGTPSSTPASTPANALAAAAPLSSDSASKPSNLFGQASSTPKFPSTTPASQPTTGGFSFPSANAASSASAAAPTPAPANTEAKSLFGNIGGNATTSAPASTPAPAASSLFPALDASKTATTSSAAPATGATTATSQPAASAPGLFGGTPKPATTTPASTTPASTTAAAPAASAAPVTTQPAATTTAPATSGATPATAATTTATTAAPATSTPNLGASTAGPVPPAQSRLKNKTMDEIITRWATDLTTYQKEFQGQAEKVATWDRMLTENSNKVQKLFANTADAERATQEVERQLASVEGQQDELSAWLDRYEREVDDMTTKQVGPGETLQGPDQERERT